MAETALEKARKQEQLRNQFNEYKNAGYILLENGKIDEKTYYQKVRDKGISLGLIDEDEYPGRLPPIAEGFLEVLGGTAGAIGGALVGGIPGAAAGAGIGSGSASLAADYLGDLIAPNMPKPSTQERIEDAAQIALIDTALTAAVPVAGKALSGTVKKAFASGKEKVKEISKQMPDQKQSIGQLEKLLGLTDEAAERANILAKEGVPLAYGQATDSAFARSLFTLTSRMPFTGKPGETQLRKTFQAVEKALDNKIMPSAKVKPLTETERSQIIKEFGLDSFESWRKNYTSLYKRAEKINKRKGKYFELSGLARTAQRMMPDSQFVNIPSDIVELTSDIQKNATQKISFNDVDALSNRLSDLLKKYDPAIGAEKNQTAFSIVTALQTTLKNQIRNPQDEAGRLISRADQLFKEYMAVVEGPTGKQFQKAFSRGALRPGIGRVPSSRVEDLYKNTFGDAKSPEGVKELKTVIGKDRVNTLTANYLDDVFNKYIKSDKRDFNRLFKELGFDNLKGKKFEATKELLKDYQYANVDDLYKFLNALKDFPEALPDVNTFVQRSAILRASQGIGPAAILGTTGVSGGVAGVGLLRFLNVFLSRPFNRDALKKYGKLSEEEKENFIRRFVNTLPKLPNVPPSAIAAQPAVPLVSEQIE